MSAPHLQFQESLPSQHDQGAMLFQGGQGQHSADSSGSEAFQEWQQQDPAWHQGLDGQTFTLDSAQLRAQHAVEQPVDGRAPGPMTAKEFFGVAVELGDLTVKRVIGQRLLSGMDPLGFGMLPEGARGRIVNSALLPRIYEPGGASGGFETYADVGQEGQAGVEADQGRPSSSLAVRARALQVHRGSRPFADGAMSDYVQQFAADTEAARVRAIADPIAAARIRTQPQNR